MEEVDSDPKRGRRDSTAVEACSSPESRRRARVTIFPGMPFSGGMRKQVW